MERRNFLKGLAAASCGAVAGETLAQAQAAAGAQSNRPEPHLLAQDSAASRPPDDPWPGKKRILAIADPEEWYSSPGYHHDAASHTLATVERLGRETGAWITVVRTDMHLLTKQPIPGFNVRNLNNFDAVFYMGEGPWNISDQQKKDLLSFVHEDGKGFIAGHAGNGGHLLLWPEYAEMIGGNLVGEFPSADMHIIVEDPKFPGCRASLASSLFAISTPSSAPTIPATSITSSCAWTPPSSPRSSPALKRKVTTGRRINCKTI